MSAASIFVIAAIAPAFGQDGITVKQDGITFKVEELSKPKEHLGTVSSSEIYKNLIMSDLGLDTLEIARDSLRPIPFDILCNSDMPEELVTYGYHSFFDGMYRAYSDHRPFVLSPDMIWLLISQGFARHVNANPEVMRDYFVDFAGKMTLVVAADDIPLDAPAEKWEAVFPQFVELLSENVKGDLVDILSADFSTTTPVDRIASQITIMDAMEPYFEFVVMYAGCGIPEITLKGTPEDWQKILDRARLLARYDLEWWTSEIVPLLEQFVRASKGKIDTKFWREMFKYHTPENQIYPPNIIDGWIVKFFPYDKDGKRNDLVSVNKEAMRGHNLPDEIVKVDIKHIEVLPSGESITTMLELWAGFIGLEQDRKTFALTPRTGWMIRKKDVQDVGLQQKFESESKGYGIHIKVKEVPPAMLELKHISNLRIDFTDGIDIPDKMKYIKIDNLRLGGEISEEETRRIKEMFPESNLNINGKVINRSTKEREIIIPSSNFYPF